MNFPDFRVHFSHENGNSIFCSGWNQIGKTWITDNSTNQDKKKKFVPYINCLNWLLLTIKGQVRKKFLKFSRLFYKRSHIELKKKRTSNKKALYSQNWTRAKDHTEAKSVVSVAAHLVQSHGTQNRSLPVSSATINFTPGVPNWTVV